MNCQAIDLKAYSFGEGTAEERRAAELHLKTCHECAEELGQLQLLSAALGGLREEEPPRRIAFVSDKVFEPNWWQRLWASGPRLGFAAAGMLSAAILVHGFVVGQQPKQVVVREVAVSGTAGAQASQAQIDEAVTKAVAQVRSELEQSQNAKIDRLLAATEKKYELERAALAAVADENELLRKQNRGLQIRTAGLVKE